MSHQLLDDVSLELSRQIARGLPAHPEWIDLAKSNLQRWSRLNRDAPRLVANYDEWRRILQRPVQEIALILVAETDDGQRLRQNSPFAGALSPAEVWEIKRQIHEWRPARIYFAHRRIAWRFIPESSAPIAIFRTLKASV